MMKEPVRKPKRPWLVVVVIVAIGAVYMTLLSESDFPEPGSNLIYDVETYANVDKVETRYEETGRINLDIEGSRAMSVAPNGNLYVAGDSEIAIYGKGDTEIGRFAVSGTPSSVTIAPDGTVFAGIRDHIEVFTSTGELQALWDSMGPRALLTSVAVGDGEVFVADAGNRVVYRFDLEGALLGRIGEADEERDVIGIVVPSPYFDVAINSEGTLWVVNPGMMGLESYRSNGDLITSWYNASLKLEGFSGCCNPSHIAFDKDDRLIVCDKGLVRIKVYEVTSGEFKELVAGTSVFDKVQALKDLAVDADNRIMVLDGMEHAVRIFEEKENASEQTD